MTQAQATVFQRQLWDRRERLAHALERVPDAPDMVRLLQDVDVAIERLNGGTYGNCRVCGDWVGDELLAGNPLARYCLCDLTPERQALLEQDLSLAGHIQTGLLPGQNLSRAGWTTHFRYLPHGPVSGDYLDLVVRDGGEDTLHFMLGDVSGKGVAASLLMAHLNALVRSLIDRGLSLAELVEQANRTFLRSTDSLHYATLVAGRARGNGQVEICNAGHWPPLVVGTNSVAPIDSGNFPVGLIDSHDYQVQRLELRPGESLVLYTDGLVEALDARGEDYGMASLIRVLERNRDRDPVLLLDAVLQDLGRFRAGQRAEDDLSLLAIRRDGSGARSATIPQPGRGGRIDERQGHHGRARHPGHCTEPEGLSASWNR